MLVTADPNQIEQLVINLAVNARDAMPAGGPLYIVASTVRRRRPPRAPVRRGPGDYARLEVRDTGNGMERVTLEHAFEPFYTTKGRARGPGSASPPSTASSSRTTATSGSTASPARARASASTCRAHRQPVRAAQRGARVGPRRGEAHRSQGAAGRGRVGGPLPGAGGAGAPGLRGARGVERARGPGAQRGPARDDRSVADRPGHARALRGRPRPRAPAGQARSGGDLHHRLLGGAPTPAGCSAPTIACCSSRSRRPT